MLVGNKIQKKIDMKPYKYLTLISLALFFYSCDSEIVVAPTAKFTPDSLECKVGSEIVFKYEGDCDYVTFWSGEDGMVYANRNRTNITVDSAYLEFKAITVWGDAKQPKPLSVYMSDSFQGMYNISGVLNETVKWDTITPSNIPYYASNTNEPYNTLAYSGKIDISKYISKSCYVAFKYNSDSITTGTARLVRIKDMNVMAYANHNLNKVMDIYNAGFTALNVSGPSTWSIATTQLEIRGASQKREEDWLISKQVTLGRVDSDRGLSVKTLTENMSNFSHIYLKAGTYNTTIEIVNSRFGKSISTFQNFTIIVKN